MTNSPDPPAPPLETLTGRHRHRRHLIAAAASLVIIGVLAAGLVLGTGGGDGERAVSTEGRATWTRQVVSTAMAPDSPAPIATDEDTTVMVTVASDGTVTSHVAKGSGPFRAGTPLRTDKPGLGITGGEVVHHDGAWIALLQGSIGGNKLQNTSLVLRSEHGLSWKVVTSAGPSDIAVNAMVAAGDHIVAVGASQSTPGSPPRSLDAVAARSVDGRTWHATELPTPGPADNTVNGIAMDVTRAGKRILAVGNSLTGPLVWASEDGGTTWDVTTIDALGEGAEASSIAARGDTVIIGGTGASGYEQVRPVTAYSTDGGRTFQVADGTPPGSSDPQNDEIGPVVAGGGRFYRTQKNSVGPDSDPGLCYEDRSLCTDSSVRLITSPDGNHWREVDRSSARGEGADDADTVAVTGHGRVSMFAFTGKGFSVWSWPAGSPVPGRTPRSTPKPTAPVIDWHTMPEPGKRYAKPIHLHCSAEFTTIGDKPWKLIDDDSPLAQVTYGQTRMPESWPVAGQELLGYVELTASDTIAYSLEDGTVIGHYERYHGQVPGCA